MTRSSSAPFDLGRFTGVCAATGRALEPGEPAVAVLIEDAQTGALTRLDYAEDAWASAPRPERLFCFWRRVVPASKAKASPAVDDEDLLGIFESLDGAEGDQQRAFRFILALHLTRRRLFRHVGVEDRSGQRVMLLRRRGADANEPPIAVPDPGLTAETIAAASESLDEALRGEA